MRYILQLAVVVAASAVGGLADPSPPRHYKLKESVDPPRGWVKHGTPPPDHIINLRIGLIQPNFELLEQHLYEVSDPDHERYGQYLSKEEVESLVAPHQESIEAVDKWLASHGFKESDIQRSPARDWVKLSVPVALAEKMLNTTYSVWQHADRGDYLVRTTSYSLPEDVFAHIDVAQPTTVFGTFKGSKSTIIRLGDAPEAIDIPNPLGINGNGEIDPGCNATITVSCLKQLYKAAGYVPKGLGSIGITGYLEEFANIEDLQSFYKEQVPQAVGTNFTFFSVKGGLNSQNLSEAGAEANLDVQFAFGVSYPIPGTFYSTAGRPPFIPDVKTPTDTNEPYTDWLDFVLSHPNPPLVISTSYGDDEQTVPESFARRACNGFAQLGARGVSLLFSSGDGGVGDNDPNPQTQQCLTNDGRNATRFIPAFPATCPYVTSVGGTVNIPEVAVQRFGSGGGFSDYFSRPSYQEKAVQRFLNTLPKGLYKGLYNPHGRAHPDISAQADRYRIWLSGRPRLIGGTSASSPATAGFIALLNDARLQKGLPPLGFLNPWLYSTAARGFNDIVSGGNPGCGTEGFNATKGWDPVTGLGTPNFEKLLEVATRGK